MRRIAALLALATLLATANAGGGGAVHAKPAPRLTDLHRIDQLRTLFNSAAGRPRLIILVSPT
jgi:hypothetical protein